MDMEEVLWEIFELIEGIATSMESKKNKEALERVNYLHDHVDEQREIASLVEKEEDRQKWLKLLNSLGGGAHA